MGAFYTTLPESLVPWILAQKMFWVATAPMSAKGHVNVSPKGGEYFGLVDSNNTFWYMELTGSGIETIAHLHERGNGRITIMFSAFEGAPRIVRLWGKGKPREPFPSVTGDRSPMLALIMRSKLKGWDGNMLYILNVVSELYDSSNLVYLGRVLENRTAQFDAFIAEHGVKTIPGVRSIILVDIHQVGSSCGYSVPYYDFKAFRETLNESFRRREEKFLAGNEKERIDRLASLLAYDSRGSWIRLTRAIDTGHSRTPGAWTVFLE
jgi:hypothetical protein